MPAAGLLNIDKPVGPTSHDVVAHVRRAAGLRRVGHAGTLDPLATGVLVVCLGWATRLVEYVTGLPKTYETTVRLGQTTPTYDAEGEVIDERPVTLSAVQVEAALAPFRGPIRQQAPLYSAIKQGGQPLYKLARRGETAEPPVRDVTIYELQMLDFRSPDVDLRVVCSTGTYIRSLAHDLGQALGCGGHVVALRRTAVGDFTEQNAVALDDLTPETWQTYLLPPDVAVAGMPRLDLGPQESVDLRHGRPIPASGPEAEGTLARAYDAVGKLLGLIRREEDRWRPHKMAPQEAQ